MLRKSVKLAVIECSGENKQNVALFFSAFNEAIETATNNTEAFFDPIGFISDEAGGILKGLVDVFGIEIKDCLKGCEFRYLQPVGAIQFTRSHGTPKDNSKN